MENREYLLANHLAHGYKTITENNKNELRIVHFPNIKIDFDELFNI